MWNVVPKVSVGPMCFGASVPDLVRVLGETPKPFRRNSAPDVEVLAFDASGVHAICDAQGAVVHLAVFKPREVQLNGVSLFGRDTDSVQSDMARAGVVLEKFDSGLWSRELNIVLFAVHGQIDGVEVTR